MNRWVHIMQDNTNGLILSGGASNAPCLTIGSYLYDLPLQEGSFRREGYDILVIHELQDANLDKEIKAWDIYTINGLTRVSTVGKLSLIVLRDVDTRA